MTKSRTFNKEHRDAARGHAIKRLNERYGIMLSDAQFDVFLRKNDSAAGLPLLFLEDRYELRMARLHEQLVLYVYKANRGVITTFLTPHQAMNTHPEVEHMSEWVAANESYERKHGRIKNMHAGAQVASKQKPTVPLGSLGSLHSCRDPNCIFCNPKS